MEKPLVSSNPTLVPISLGLSPGVSNTENHLAGTTFQSDAALTCDVVAQCITSQLEGVDPVYATSQMDVQASGGSPRALGMQGLVGDDICLESSSGSSPPAGTAMELNLPVIAVGATDFRSPVAPGVALLQDCKATGAAEANLQQVVVKFPLEAVVDLQRDAPSNDGIFPQLGHSSSQKDISNISNITEVNSGSQTLIKCNYETKQVLENTKVPLTQVTGVGDYCGVENSISTTGGAMRSNFPEKQSEEAFLLHLDQGNVKQQQMFASSKIVDLKNKDNNIMANRHNDKIGYESVGVGADGTLRSSSVHKVSAASNSVQTSVTTGTLTYASVVAPPNACGNPTTGYTKDCAVIMERLQATSLDTYIEAIWDTMQQRSITYIGQAPDDPASVLVFVKTGDLADLLVREGIWIGWKWVKVSALQQRATKIVISGALPFISDASIAQQLSSYGKLAYSQFRRIPAATRAASHKGILSFRREAFIILHEQKQIPERITLLEDGKLYTLEVSSEGPKCFRCGRRGHLAVSCKEFKERVGGLHTDGLPLHLPLDAKLSQPKVVNTATRHLTSEEDGEEEAWTEVKSRRRKVQKTDIVSTLEKGSSIGDKVATRNIGIFGQGVRTLLPVRGKGQFNSESFIADDISSALLAQQCHKVMPSGEGNPKGAVTFISSSADLAGAAAMVKKHDVDKRKRYGSQLRPKIAVAKSLVRSHGYSYSCSTESTFKVLSNKTPQIVDGLKSPSKLTMPQKQSLLGPLEQHSHGKSDVKSNGDLHQSNLEKDNYGSPQKLVDGNDNLHRKYQLNVGHCGGEVAGTTGNSKEGEDDYGLEERASGITYMEVQEGAVPLELESLLDDGQKRDEHGKEMELQADLKIKRRHLVEQLISESKSLRVSKRKDLVSRYVTKVPNLKHILESMLITGDDPCCLKGSPPYKRVLMILEDLATMDRTPKTRAENRKPLKKDECIEVDGSYSGEVAEGYWKKYPPDGSVSMDIELGEHDIEQNPIISGEPSVSPYVMSQILELTPQLNEVGSQELLDKTMRYEGTYTVNDH